MSAMDCLKRYEFHGEDERTMQFGREYVTADDYDALKAEHDALKHRLASLQMEHLVPYATLTANLKAQNERVEVLLAALSALHKRYNERKGIPYSLDQQVRAALHPAKP